MPVPLLLCVEQNPFLAPPEPSDPPAKRKLTDLLRHLSSGEDRHRDLNHVGSVYARNYAADPLRTEVLDYLHSQAMLDQAWTVIPAVRRRAIVRRCRRNEAIRDALRFLQSDDGQWPRWTQLRHEMLRRHPGQEEQIDRLLVELMDRPEEVEAYGRALRDYAGVPDVWETDKEVVIAMEKQRSYDRIKAIVRDALLGD